MEYRPIPIATRRGYQQNTAGYSAQTLISYDTAAARSGMKWPHSSSSPNKMMHVSQSPMMVPMNTGGLILNNKDILQQHVSVENAQMIDVIEDASNEVRSARSPSKQTASCKPLTLIILTTVGLALLTIAIALPMTVSWAQSRSAFIRSTTIEQQGGSNENTATNQPDQTSSLPSSSTAGSAGSAGSAGYAVTAAALSSFASISSLITVKETSTESSRHPPRPPPPSALIPPPPAPASTESQQTQAVSHSVQIAEEMLAAVSASTVCEEVLNVVRFRTGLTNVLFKRNSLPMHQLINLNRPIMISANGMISPYYSHIKFANLTAQQMYRNLAACSRDQPLPSQSMKNLTCSSPGISFRLTCAQVELEETVECAFRASAGCVSSAESRVQSSTSYNRLRSDWVLWCSVTTLV